jgi:hypothetical protein
MLNLGFYLLDETFVLSGQVKNRCLRFKSQKRSNPDNMVKVDTKVVKWIIHSIGVPKGKADRDGLTRDLSKTH